MRIVLIGRGKMGTLIRETAAAAGDEIRPPLAGMIWISWEGWGRRRTW